MDLNLFDNLVIILIWLWKQVSTAFIFSAILTGSLTGVFHFTRGNRKEEKEVNIIAIMQVELVENIC